MAPIRVLHIVTYMGRAGLETMLMNYYRNIDREKVQFDFLVHRDFEADYDSEILSLGGKIYRLPKLNPFNKSYLNALDAFFAEHREYKIVHSHLDCMSAIPLKYAKKHGVPIRIAHSHSSNQDKNAKYLIKLLYRKKIPKVANHLFACSKDAGRWTFNNKDFTIINNAIDAKKYIASPEINLEVRQEFSVDVTTLVIGLVGRFAGVKNHKFLIDVFAKLKTMHPNTKLLLVGDGDLRTEIQTKVGSLGLSSDVIFTGVRNDIHKLVQAIDVFVMPSFNEGLPVSLIEAQASGVPCLISTGIPRECAITDTVKFLSLDAELTTWCNTILEMSTVERVDQYDRICSAGFDICSNADKLQNFYLEQIQKESN